MAKGDFIIMRAKPDDRAVLEYCKRATRGSTADVLREAMRRYMAALKRRVAG